ncbi:hypothetical protein PIB30_100484 [Stylosanthes scabra]|uniref:Uncharacterized protein n=1 Tax=Stylosanthes scabra TaxID=79078 RepID=A0ABU6WX31_9FABA|nr:hypothetical protein [Stylosanthes scabra]
MDAAAVRSHRRGATTAVHTTVMASPLSVATIIIFTLLFQLFLFFLSSLVLQSLLRSSEVKLSKLVRSVVNSKSSWDPWNKKEFLQDQVKLRRFSRGKGVRMSRESYMKLTFSKKVACEFLSKKNNNETKE